MSRWSKCAAVAAALVVFQNIALAESLPVQDAIFSNPLVSYEQQAMPFAFTTGTGWSANGANPTNAEDIVIWQNPPPGADDYVDNLVPDNSVTLSQCLAQDSNPDQWSLQFSSLFPYEGAASIGALDQNSLTQTLGSVFQANMGYSLTVAVGIPYYLDAPGPDAEADLQLALFYTDANGIEIVSSTDVLNNADTGLSGTQMLDLSTPLTFIAPDDAAVGQPIGILMEVSDPENGGGFFNVSDVVVTQVPEPASISALLASSALLLHRRRRAPAV